MALAALLFSNRTQRNIGGLSVDVTIRERHERENEVTNHPIEDGTEVSDHVIRNPVRLSMEGVVTNSPLSGGYVPRAQEAFDILDQLWRERQLITVVTGFGRYANMVITHLDKWKDHETGDALQFTAELQEIVTVASLSTVISAPQTLQGADDAGTRDLATPTQERGRRSPGTPSAPTQQKSSILSDIFK